MFRDSHDKDKMNCGILIMGIFRLVRWHIYIKTAPNGEANSGWFAKCIGNNAKHFFVVHSGFQGRLKPFLTHWGRVMHVCISKLAIIGWDNGLLPGRHQAIISTNAGILLIGHLGTFFMVSTTCVLNHIAVSVVVWAVLRQWNVVVQSTDLISIALIQATSPNTLSRQGIWLFGPISKLGDWPKQSDSLQLFRHAMGFPSPRER